MNANSSEPAAANSTRQERNFFLRILRGEPLISSTSVKKTTENHVDGMFSNILRGQPFIQDSWIHECFLGSHDVMACLNSEGGILYANPALLQTSGLSLTEICERKINAVLPDCTSNIWIHFIQQMKEGQPIRFNSSVENSQSRKRQFEFTLSWIESCEFVFVVGRPMQDGHIDPLSAQYRQSEKRYQGLVESQTDLIVRIDWEGRFTFVNDAYCVKAGKPRETLIGTKFIPQVHPDDVPRVFKMMKQLATPPYRGVSVHRSWTHLGWRKFQWEACAIHDDAGKIIELQGVGRDITEHLEAESRLKLHAQELVRRNQELEEFAYVASHDLKEPLRMITNFLQLLQMKYTKQLPDEAHQFIGYALGGSQRLMHLIQALLEYAQVSSSKIRLNPVNTQQVVDAACLNLKHLVDESSAEIFYRDLPVVHGHFNLLVELFQNLIDNSLKYRRETRPKIRVRAIKQSRNYLFSVTDNGKGLPARFNERVFRLFQRLEPRDSSREGTGIGLTVAKRIVERHEGKIWVESQEGVGTTFYFTLPLPSEENSVDAENLLRVLHSDSPDKN